MNRPISTGVIGYGLAGRVFHTPFLAASADFSLDMIATGNPTRRDQASARYPGAAIVSSPDELLARGSELDLIVLATPAHTHRELGEAAFAAGAAVVVDKPFAPSSEDAEALIDASMHAGRPLIVFQNRRWDGDFLTLQELVASGRLGRIHRFESTFERWSPTRRERWQDRTTQADGGGITFDIGSHLIDQALVLFGPVMDLHAELSPVRDGAVSEDDAFLSLLHDSGVRSHLSMSSVAALSGPRFRVLGTQGAYSVDGLDGQESALDDGVLPSDPVYGTTPPSHWGTVSDGHTERIPTLRGDYPAFYSGVAAAVRGEAAPPVDPHDALEVVRIIEWAHRVAAQHASSADLI
ncbi:Gfo/Idh/MocA family protein [Tessaracoccus antarcticus]|uniref:Oxidoreductase n=1 Tax=Tessaracoccus antarcticus TaxID=2479848 RepID=A0A3M0G9V3_9ACTN|nr:Gfo/Idh/MocA family oxidoreductase [Tessaracoccus antarcticus]RMB61821.1 oxidoreductase [Tessaracoccus antarcticus]